MNERIVSDGTETSGSSPEHFQMTIQMHSHIEMLSFRDWVNSGDCSRLFWEWMSRNGRRV